MGGKPDGKHRNTKRSPHARNAAKHSQETRKEIEYTTSRYADSIPVGRRGVLDRILFLARKKS